jgi:putative ABC transport system permease protein
MAQSRFAFLPITLAGWQLRQTWRLLLVIGAGVVAAVIIICAVPLYSQISETAELQSALSANPANASLLVQASAQKIYQPYIQQAQLKITGDFDDKLGSFLQPGAQFSAELDDQSIAYPSQKRVNGKEVTTYVNSSNLFNLVGETMAQAKPHIDLIAGSLPESNNNAVEIAITPAMAKSLDLKPGSLMAIQVPYDVTAGERAVAPYIDLIVVGIFKPDNSAFWQGQSFACSLQGKVGQLCTVLVDNDGFLSTIQQISFTVSQQVSPSFSFLSDKNTVYLENQISLNWYYALNVNRITVNNFPTLEYDLGNIGADSTSYNDGPYVMQAAVNDPISGVLDQFANRNAVVQIPIVSLSLLVVGLTLFFVITMTDIVVDRQSDAIAVLRSRGASRWQIFSALFVQSVGICLLALVAGPLVAIVVVPLFSLATLPHADISAVTVIAGNLPGAIQAIIIPTLVTVGVALLAMALAVGGAVQRGILALRREAARSMHRPLWQRVNADVVAAIIALAGFAFSVYEASPGVLDERVRVLVLPPLTLAGVVFLLLGLSLLLLRAFPLILRGGSRLTQRNRGATPMLAVAQMARAPRQSLRMTMLLAFSIAFAIFAIVFNASQTQRILDVANYEVGADFSGQIASSSGPVTSATYERLPGVLSASIGYTSFPTVTQGSNPSVSVQLLAVDANTFANTVIWSAQDSTQPIAALMQRLVAARASAKQSLVVPAIVDSAAWTSLHLTPGAIFQISDVNGTVNCKAIAEVQRIPTVNDSALASGTNEFSASGGVLLDYQSFAAAALGANGSPVSPSNVWLKTSSDPRLLAQTRAALNGGTFALSDLNDRRAIISNLQNDPLYLDLTGLLVIGAVIAILLALVGNLIASWLSVRSRLTSFAVLRALGTTPAQLASIFTWEQGIVYATALILGVVFGILLSALALPSMVFTNIAVSGFSGSIDSGQYYILQTIPPIRIVIPPTLWVVGAIIVAICIIALIMMVRVVARPSVSQTLRLNED